MLESLGPWGTPLLSFLSALLGGVVAHFLTIYRDRASKRREIVVNQFVQLWKTIDSLNGNASRSQGLAPPDLSPINQIVQDVQLYGTDEHVRMVKEIVDALKSGQDAALDSLQKSVLNEVRSQIGLPKLTEGYFWVRFSKIPQQASESKDPK